MAGLLNLDLSSLLGNGLLSQWLGGSGLNTPQPSPFQTPPSLFGSGILGRGLRGGLAGLAGSTGYQGWSAVGAGAQAGAQEERQRQLFDQQNALGGQQFAQGQQGLISGNIGIAQTLMRVNYMRQRLGQAPLTLAQVMANPSLLSDPTGQGTDAAQGSAAQSGAAPQIGGVNPMAPPPQAGSGLQPGPTQQPDNSDPYGFNQAVNDGLFIDPKFGTLELNAAQAQPAYQQAQAMWKLGLTQAPDGSWRNQDGSVASQAQLAGAVEGAKAWAGVGPANAQKAFAQSVTPTTLNVAGPNNSTIPVNTNALAAAQGGSFGPTTLSQTDTAMLPKLVDTVANNQTAAAAAADSLAQLGELRKALTGLPTGPGTEILNDAAAAFQKAGIDINNLLPPGYATDPTKYAIAAKNINTLGMAMARANFPGGRITNADLLMALKATPNFWNNPEANKTLLDNIEAIQRIKIDRAQFDREYIAKNGGPSLAMEDQWKQRVDGMKNVPDLIKSSMQSYTDLANNPNAPQTPALKLPPDAIQYASKGGHTVYLYKGPTGYFWGDENKKPVQ